MRLQFMYNCSRAMAVIDIASAYTSGLVQNHPFFDGNKRTGFVVGILFLELNGFDFIASEAEAGQAVLGLAAGPSAKLASPCSFGTM